MGLFNFFQKIKKVGAKEKLSPEVERDNKIWDLWSEDKLPSPVADLMLYQAEVNNGGHDQFFFNLHNRIEEDAPGRTISAIRSLLYGEMLKNFDAAYSAFKAYDDDEDKACEILEKCDDFYYENEEEIMQILERLWSELDI